MTVQNVPGLRLCLSQVTLLHGICNGAGIIPNVLLLPLYSFLSEFPSFLSTDKQSVPDGILLGTVSGHLRIVTGEMFMTTDVSSVSNARNVAADERC